MNDTQQPSRTCAAQIPARYYSVTGVLKLANGQGRMCKVIVPCVYPVDWQPGVDDVADIGHSETVLVALELVRRSNPGCLWANERAIDIRPANPLEHAWAQAHGVDELFNNRAFAN